MAQEPSVTGDLPRGIVAFPGAKVRGPDGPRTRPGGAIQAQSEPVWAELRDLLVDRWPVLTAGELDATHGEAGLVEALLEAKLGYGRRLVDETFRPWQFRAARPRRGAGRGLLSVIGLMSVSGFAFFGLL